MDTLEEYLSIDTPENVVFGYEVAGIGSRFLAALADTLFVTMLQVLVILTALSLMGILTGPTLEANGETMTWTIGILGLIAFAFQWGYYVFFEMRWNGQSPGKRWARIRVMRKDGTPITLAESIIRNLVRLVDFLPAYYGVGVVTMFIDKQCRRLGDLTAGTLVVYDRSEVSLESLKRSPIPQPVHENDLTAIADLPLERLTEQDIQLAEDFLRRRWQLPRDAATRLATRVAKALAARMEIDPIPPGAERAIDLIKQVVRAGQETEGGRSP